MRILYIGHTRFPTEKAHGKQIAEVCSAMAALGHVVTLVTPTVRTPITESPFLYYNLPENFTWVKLTCFDALQARFVPRALAFLVGMWSYRRALKTYLRTAEADLLYCRSHVVLPMLLLKNIPTIIELHTLPRSRVRLFSQYCNRCVRVVALTSPMRRMLLIMGVDSSRILVEGDGVRSSSLSALPSLATFEERFQLQPVIGYVGSLVARNTLEKGVNVLIDAFVLLKQRGIPFRGLIVGGPESWKTRYEKEAHRKGLDVRVFLFTGHMPARDIPPLTLSADILVYPAPATQHPYFLRDTSPLKLFEYMAAMRPIITADLPPVRDILTETEAYFFPPGDAEGLADRIQYILLHAAETHAKVANAGSLVPLHTWEKRMERILQL